MATSRDDQGTRTGVVAKIEVAADGVKLVLLDVERKSATTWKTVRLYTENTYAERSFVDLALRPKQYEEIGFNLVNRLCALAGLEPANSQSSKPTRRKRR
jgi:hypothetical protein